MKLTIQLSPALRVMNARMCTSSILYKLIICLRTNLPFPFPATKYHHMEDSISFVPKFMNLSVIWHFIKCCVSRCFIIRPTIYHFLKTICSNTSRTHKVKAENQPSQARGLFVQNATRLNIQKFYVRPTHCISVTFMGLRTSTDYSEHNFQLSYLHYVFSN